MRRPRASNGRLQVGQRHDWVKLAPNSHCYEHRKSEMQSWLNKYC